MLTWFAVLKTLCERQNAYNEIHETPYGSICSHITGLKNASHSFTLFLVLKDIIINTINKVLNSFKILSNFLKWFLNLFLLLMELKLPLKSLHNGCMSNFLLLDSGVLWLESCVMLSPGYNLTVWQEIILYDCTDINNSQWTLNQYLLHFSDSSIQTEGDLVRKFQTCQLNLYEKIVVSGCW